MILFGDILKNETINCSRMVPKIKIAIQIMDVDMLEALKHLNPMIFKESLKYLPKSYMKFINKNLTI